MRGTRLALGVSMAVLAAGLLAACSSDESGTAEGSSAAAASPAASGAAAPSPEMQALCDQMIADGLSSDDATALAEENGYVARVGMIDGEPQAVTMDYREDRFTLETEGGAVVACTYG